MLDDTALVSKSSVSLAFNCILALVVEPSCKYKLSCTLTSPAKVVLSEVIDNCLLSNEDIWFTFVVEL